MNTDKRYPLCWPDGWPRTLSFNVKSSSFRVTQDSAQNNLLAELKRLGAKEIIISTNIRLRNDGLPYSSQRAPEDRGVSVYFKYKKRNMVFACDKFKLVGDNIHAIGKTIEALRGIERWGASDMLERAFTGFESLPGPDHVVARSWRDVLEYYENDPQEANERYLIARAYAHPDKGGTEDKFNEVQKAWEQCQEELNF